MRFYLLLFALFLGLPLSAQKKELLKSVSLDACECIKNANLDQDFETTLGLCMLRAATPRAEELEAALDLDLSDLNNYERLGELLAPSLMMHCPEFMDYLLQSVDDGEIDLDTDNTEEAEEESPSFGQWSDIAGRENIPAYGGPENKKIITEALPNTSGVGLKPLSFSGKITEIRSGMVNEIQIRNSEGETAIFYLETAAAGSERLKKGQEVRIVYKNIERFNAAVGQSQQVKVILAVE